MRVSDKKLPTRFWIECGLAAITGVLFVVTFFWHDWMEAFGFDPDHGDGSAEWIMVAALAVLTVALFAVARLEWRRAQPA